MSLQTILIKPASSQCSMTCDYCFYCDEASKREQQSYGIMSEKTLKNIIKKTLFQATGDVCFAFQGGEPTLCGLPFFEKVVDFEQRFNRNHVRISNALQTNGLQLTEDWCRFFHDHQFLIGISVDGIPETHDRCRHTKSGLPTYERIYQSTLLLNQYQVEYNILTVVNAYTASHIQEIYAHYKRNGWNYQQYITCLEPLGEEDSTHHYSLTPEMYGKFLVQLFHMWHKDWKRGKAPYIREFENYIGILMGYFPESCAQRGICTVQGVVEADGSTYPCDFYVLDEFKLGNFNEDSIENFITNDRAVAFVTESQKISPKCKACIHYPLCRGGCRRTRVKEKDSDTYRSYFCESYQTFFSKATPYMKEIASFLLKK